MTACRRNQIKPAGATFCRINDPFSNKSMALKKKVYNRIKGTRDIILKLKQ